MIFCKFHLTENNTTKIDEIALSGLYRRAFKQVLQQYAEIYNDPDAAIELDSMSKTFSQDIINSLGDRLKDFIIPILTDRTHIMRISSMVKRSIDDSIEARELAKRAGAEVFL